MIRTRNIYTARGGQPIAEDGQPCAQPLNLGILGINRGFDR